MSKIRAALTGSFTIFCICMVSVFVIDYIMNDVSFAKMFLISVMASLLALPVFLSVCGEDGQIIVDEGEDNSLRFTIECNEDPEEWVDKDYITLSVKRKETEED